MAQKTLKESVLTGYPICPGIAIAKPICFAPAEEQIPEFSVSREDVEGEVARYYRALKKSRRDVQHLQASFAGEGEAAAILGAHLEMMRDPMMTVEIEKKIREKGKNTEYVFKNLVQDYEERFSRISNQLFQQRVKDFQDITRRIIGHLRNSQRATLADLESPAIVFAEEISPSNTAEANQMIEAFVTSSGAETSHVAIMARTRGIPFVSAVEFPDFSVSMPPLVIVDGFWGKVILNPSMATLKEYEEKKKQLKVVTKELLELPERACTLDGFYPRITANIDLVGEVDALDLAGAEGIGLFRSEYLFLAQDRFPSEEEQFEVYRSLVERMGHHTCVIRAFDIGGDKLGNLYPSRYEKNPYLGCRAIRFLMRERQVFEAQLRAIIRASAFGEVAILLPLVSGVQEFDQVLELVHDMMKGLEQEQIPFSRTIPVGCMIELPSAALTSDLLAPKCDFFSIGTNDLVQYTLGVDRNNADMRYLYKAAHPSVLRLISRAAREGNKAKIPVAVCGEIAADRLFTALLLGLGVTELSVAPMAVPHIKQTISKLNLAKCQELAEMALACMTTEEVEQLLQQALAQLD